MVGGNIDESGMKKGPWSTEEDEVLINFVKKNGPRDWSSIRSKGLLPRTGKSCRLRWVNKLRPNLKVGCKFTTEEERIVVELQARFGNKWARIASYLPGRTDNDVKNFWSSRRKRLARILMSSSNPSNKCQKQSKQRSTLDPQLPSNFHVPGSNNSNIQVNESTANYHPLQSSSFPSNIEIASPIPGLMGSETGPLTSPKPMGESLLPDPLWITEPLREIPPTLSYTQLIHDHETKDLVLPTFGEPISCLELFPWPNASDLDENIAAIDFGSPSIGGLMEGSCSKSGGQVDLGDNLGNPDCFFDDFPTDVFDCIDPFPSSSSLN